LGWKHSFTVALHDIILAALDSAIAESEWDVADKLLGAMEALCRDDELDARLAEAYMRIGRSMTSTNG
jgi:hypothetical protein